MLARARVLPDPALPPLPQARARYRGWALLLPSGRSGSFRTVSTHPPVHGGDYTKTMTLNYDEVG